MRFSAGVGDGHDGLVRTTLTLPKVPWWVRDVC